MRAQHDFEMMSLQDGEIYDAQFGPTHPPLLRCRELTVKNTGDVKATGDGRVRFQFLLSEAPDAPWTAIFFADLKEEKKFLPASDVTFAGNEMFIVCREEQIQGFYSHVKDVMRRTAFFYDREREGVLAALKARAAEGARAAQTADQRAKALQESFSKMQL